MGPPPYSAKARLLKCTPDCGTHLKDTLNPTPCLSLSPPPVKIEVTVLYPLDKHLKNVFRAARWEP